METQLLPMLSKWFFYWKDFSEICFISQQSDKRQSENRDNTHFSRANYCCDSVLMRCKALFSTGRLNYVVIITLQLTGALRLNWRRSTYIRTPHPHPQPQPKHTHAHTQLKNPWCQSIVICQPCPLTPCLWKYCSKGHRLEERWDREGRNVREITVAGFRAARLACHFKSQRVGLIIPITGVGLIPELQPLLISCFIVLWFPF